MAFTKILLPKVREMSINIIMNLILNHSCEIRYINWRNERIPSLKVDFGTTGVDVEGERTLALWNIYRSNRYVFCLLGSRQIYAFLL